MSTSTNTDTESGNTFTTVCAVAIVIILFGAFAGSTKKHNRREYELLVEVSGYNTDVAVQVRGEGSAFVPSPLIDAGYARANDDPFRRVYKYYPKNVQSVNNPSIIDVTIIHEGPGWDLTTKPVRWASCNITRLDVDPSVVHYMPPKPLTGPDTVDTNIVSAQDSTKGKKDRDELPNNRSVNCRLVILPAP